MNITYQSDHALVVAELKAMTAALPNATHRAAQTVAGLILNATRSVMKERIYDQPLPKSYAKFGKFHRTGALMASEVLIASGDGFLITTRDHGINEPHWSPPSIIENPTVDIESGGIYEKKNPEEYYAWRHYASGPDWMAGEWRDRGVSKVEHQIDPTFTEALSRNIPGALLAP